MQNQNQHKHFKMSDEISEFMTSHKKIAILIAVFATLILCAIIFIIFVPEKRSLILSNPNEENKIQADLNLRYQEALTPILQEYWQNYQTETFFKEPTCQTIINSTVNKVLNLTVPFKYKEFHLNLVVLLSQDEKSCEEKIISNKTTNNWQNFFSSNSWLIIN